MTTVKKFLKYLIGLIILLGGLLVGILFFTNPSSSSQTPAISQKGPSPAAQTARQNVQGLNPDLDIKGALVYPNAHIYGPLVEGLTEENMHYGIATFYPDEQTLDEGNYPVTSHNIDYFKKGVLLSPIVTEAKIGDLVYVTDLQNIYTFKVDFNETVPETRVDLVETNWDHPILTMMTCSKPVQPVHTRKIVQASLVDTVDFDHADEKILELFQPSYNFYKFDHFQVSNSGDM